jgi:hypothetical protein
MNPESKSLSLRRTVRRWKEVAAFTLIVVALPNARLWAASWLERKLAETHGSIAPLDSKFR